METKDRTLEEIDALFEGEKHSNAPNLELVRRGKEVIDVGAMELELQAQIDTKDPKVA